MGGKGAALTPQTQLVIPVLSSPFAAALAAMGVTHFMETLGRDVTGHVVDVRVQNRGDAIVVSTDVLLTPEQVRVGHYTPPPLWIQTAKNGAPPPGVAAWDYEAEKQHNSEYYEVLKTYQKAGISINKLSQDQRNDLEQRAPRPDWPVAAVINQMGALSAYNKAIERWAACRQVYPELVVIVWTLFSGDAHALEAAQAQWEALAKQHKLEKSPLLPATQVANPEQGKGANRAKADALTIGGQESFWLLEYFKFAGLYHAALPRTVQGKKDRKTYVVLPSREGVLARWHRQVFTQFQKEFWATSAIKMDVQATLRYTGAMLAQWQAAQQAGGRRRRVSDFVDGFVVAAFKDLGSAVAVMNVATLRLPDWVEWPATVKRAKQLQTLISDHQKLTGALDEKKGEEEQLLRDYRDFLSSRDPQLSAFFDFTAGYAGHALRKMSKREPVRRLSIDNLEVILMANDERRNERGLLPLTDIVSNSGFRNIATAIRASTVTQQFYKSQQDDNTYEIRYGLADELRRKARDKREFVRALSEFLQQYSQENARVQERNKGKPYRKRIPISTTDITQVVDLIDRYDSPTVANLLIAFGYARDPKVDDDMGKTEGSTDEPFEGEADAETGV